METWPELFAVRSPLGNPTIGCSRRDRSVKIRCIPTHERRRIQHVEPLCHPGSSTCMAVPVGAAPVAHRRSACASRPGGPASGRRHQPAATRGCRSVGASRSPGHPRRLAPEVVGSNETQLPVAPLTTAISSREYLVAGTFTGKITGGGKTKLTGGSMEAGEQIGCGIISDETEINPGASFTPGIGIPFTGQRNRRLRCQPAGQGVPEAGHGDHRGDRQEVVQGHLDPRHHHRVSGSRPTSVPASPSSARTRR